MENRRKEVEVEANRTRQQLTESKQKCSKLEDEVGVNFKPSLCVVSIEIIILINLPL